jgi:hypothetical protein
MYHVVGLRSQLTLSHCHLAQAYQLVSLVVIHDPYRRFTYVRHVCYLALTCLLSYQEGSDLAVLSPCISALCYIVELASLFRALDSSCGNDGLFILRETSS